MSPKTPASAPDISADPFWERKSAAPRARIRLLGGEFDFESDSPELRRIVAWAYANLPRHKLAAVAPRFTIRLALGKRERTHSQGEAPRIEMLSGADLLGATTSGSDFVVLSPAQRAGLIVVSRNMLRCRYHVRYELIEFAVFTLATRAQGLVPLHAACVGRDGRGLLLMGASGAGKSTTSLLSLLHGLEFLSEDSVFVAPDTLLATGVANFLHVTRDALRFVPDSSAAQIRRSPVIRRRSGVEKFEIDLRRPEFRLAPRPLRIVGSIFMTAETAGRRPLLAPLRRADTLERLQACQPYAAHQAGWTLFKKRIAGAPAFELRRGGHPTEAVAALEEQLAATTHG
jgi:hypothetical protein